MGTLMRTLIAMLAGVVPALAAKGDAPEDGGLLLLAFLGFGAIILTFQIIPAVVMFVSMVKGVFLPKLVEKSAVAVKDTKGA